MSRTQLWLLATLAFASLVDGYPLFHRNVMSAPNVLQVGTPENIFVECPGCTELDVKVNINVMDHLTKKRRLATTSVTLTMKNFFQGLGQILIPAEYFSKHPNKKQYVYLQAQFPDRLLEKLVLVSIPSSYIFIQTDKPLYIPNSAVHFRMFVVTPRMEPVERDDQFQNGSIAIEIVTPEGLITSNGDVPVESGIISRKYQLDEIASPGLWKIKTRFNNNPHQSFSSAFEVKQSVLPSFEVKLTPASSFIYVDSPELTINIRATYLFGEEVHGTAQVLFGIEQNIQKTFHGSFQKVLIKNGDGVVQMKTQTFTINDAMVGSSIFVAVSVLTESGGEMVKAELRGIQIVTSPYTIHFKRTPKFFEQGMSFAVEIEVLNPDETPAQGVAVLMDPAAVQILTAANGIARLVDFTFTKRDKLTITATTKDPRISSNRQATATMVALPYKAKDSGSLISIKIVNKAELRLGATVVIRLYLNRPPKNTEITYLILSRGRLVTHGRSWTRDKAVVFLTFPITMELMPSFRFIAYYHENDNEVVSNSATVLLDVKDSCIGSPKLESSRPARSYEQGSKFGLKVTGDPGATVGLLAVDKSIYYFNNNHRLTKKKVRYIGEKHDTGCTPGGGKDSMSVFFDAGLLFESSTASGTPVRQELKCGAPSRRKRALKGINVLGSFGEGEKNIYTHNFGIVSQTKFPESWLWSDIKLPACPPQTPNCDSTSLIEQVSLPDSITTWQFTGISLSRTHGVCVGEPLEVIVRKIFFIDLRLPHSAVRGKELEVQAILHNYSPDDITVRVDLISEKELFCAASNRFTYRREVRVGAKTTRSVTFVIIPMREGQFQVEVKAAVEDSSLTDGIIKMLRVVPQGVLVSFRQVITLDPSRKGSGGKQEEIINSGIPMKDWVPNTATRTLIIVTGRGNVGKLMENASSEKSMEALIYQPKGNGEENLINMTSPVIATMYLDKTIQWGTGGFEKRNKALKHIMTGYQNELDFRHKDGSFSVWKNNREGHGSTWLTAYVAKVFTMANTLVELQSNVICDAVKFLSFAQLASGTFAEVGPLSYKKMTGDLRGTDSDAYMTAFCLVALQESRTLCAADVTSLPGSIDRAVAHLEKRLPSLTNPYAVAMTSYALANEGKLNRDFLFKFASPELSHWPLSWGRQYTLEATAYALLALVKANAFENARPVVRWFNQQKVDGGYGSTQATVLVYQALAEYWASAHEPEYDLNVDILLPGRTKPDNYNFNNFKNEATKPSKINVINQDVKVTATGTGEATVTMVSQYYALPTEKKSNCRRFSMSVDLIPEEMDEEIYTLRITVLYMDKGRDANKSILDIGLLTGFTVDSNDLDLLSGEPSRTITKYEMNTLLSERGSLIINLDKVSHTQPEVITFRILQKLKVGTLQPAAVSINEYKDPETQCVKFYNPVRRAADPPEIVEENCSMHKKGNISNLQRRAKSCENTLTSVTEFVYKVRLEEFPEGFCTGIYPMRILEVIRAGSYDEGPLGKLRTFVGYPHCRESLDLGKGKMYLFMGSSADIQPSIQNKVFQYVLGERSWIEYWPTDAECQTDEHRATCLGLEEMVRSGC